METAPCYHTAVESSRVGVLLAVWESSHESLAECRAALEATGWDARVALASLNAPSSKPRPEEQRSEDASPSKLLAKYKTIARELRDVAPGTLPRSLVWVTERASTRPAVVAHWNRHRFFLGGPRMRRFAKGGGGSGGPWLQGGYVRLVRDLDQAPCASQREEALLACWDAQWVIA